VCAEMESDSGMVSRMRPCPGAIATAVMGWLAGPAAGSYHVPLSGTFASEQLAVGLTRTSAVSKSRANVHGAMR
jgi:hypothetical protein